MAGAIALDLRDGERKMCLLLHSIVAIVRCIRILTFHSFVHAASLGLYSPARCIYQGLLGSIPGRASWLARAGGIFDRYLIMMYQLYPHRLYVHKVSY